MASGKRPTSDSFPPRKKRGKNVFTLEIKLEIIRRLENGETPASLGRTYGVNESSIRTIKKMAQKIKDAVVGQSTSLSAKVISRVRNPSLEKMERMLGVWVEDQNQKMVPITFNIVQEKALELYAHLNRDDDDDEGPSSNDEPFLASKGWFDNFRKRQHVHLRGETDPAAAFTFADEFKELVSAGAYAPRQVFNASNTSLFWKRIPSKSCVSTEDQVPSDFKLSKERLTLLLCANAEGDFKCKPLLVYHSQNPGALKGLSQHTLPVYWRSHRRAWITSQLFEDWFVNCFCVEAERYCRDAGVAFKVLLVLDKSPGHPAHLNDLHRNVRVLFLPPNATALIQPMHQGVVSNFKVQYLKWMLSKFSDATRGPDGPSVCEFWDGYNILHAINVIRSAWDEVTSAVVNNAWEALWKDCVRVDVDANALFGNASAEMAEIISIGRNIGSDGLEDLQEADVVELLESHEEEMSTEDLMLLAEREDKEQDDATEPRRLTTSKLARFFALADQLAQEAVDMDPNLERSLQFGRSLTSSLATYKQIYKEKRRTPKEAGATDPDRNGHPSPTPRN